jgi:hypothetical protein
MKPKITPIKLEDRVYKNATTDELYDIMRQDDFIDSCRYSDDPLIYNHTREVGRIGNIHYIENNG